MPIDQVAELLAQWRGTGGMFGRARVLREGIQLLAGLDADERRMLARLLTEQGAPKLGERVEGRTGGALSADQLWSVADGLLNMEDHQVDRLAASLRDPAERERLAREALTGAAATFTAGPEAASDPRSRLDELPPPGTNLDQPADRSEHGREDEGPRGQDLGDQELGDQDLGDQDLGDQDLGDQVLGDQDLGTVALGDAGIVDAGIVSVGLHHMDAGAPTIAARTEEREREGDGVTRQAHPGEPAPVPRSGSTVAASQADQAAAGFSAIDAGREVPVALPVAVDPGILGAERTTPRDATGLHEHLREAETATARFRLLDPHALAGLDGTTALAVLDALPEGWQRRRAAERLVDAGRFPTDRLAEAFTRFARATDAVFVAGALLAADQVRAERFEGILPERAVLRLVARSER